jgi:hypothetical protein
MAIVACRASTRYAFDLTSCQERRSVGRIAARDRTDDPLRSALSGRPPMDASRFDALVRTGTTVPPAAASRAPWPASPSVERLEQGAQQRWPRSAHPDGKRKRASARGSARMARRAAENARSAGMGTAPQSVPARPARVPAASATKATAFPHVSLRPPSVGGERPGFAAFRIAVRVIPPTRKRAAAPPANRSRVNTSAATDSFWP